MLRAKSLKSNFIMLTALLSLTGAASLAAQQTAIGPAACSSGREQGSVTLAKPLTDSFADDLITKYGPSPNVPVRFENKEGASLIITDARVTLVNHPSEEGYVAKAVITLVNNNKDRRITGFSFHFTNSGKELSYDPDPVFCSIEPNGSLTYEKLQSDYLSYWIGDPERLLIKVAAIDFEDQDEQRDTTDVDRNPILLSGLPTIVIDDPNRTTKEITLKVRVSVFGRVKKVIIEDELTDKIREEVLQAAYKARFKPAIRNGQPVAYWSTVTIQITSKLNIPQST